MTILTGILLTAYIGLRFGLNVPPSASGDEPSYDAIGWQLSLGQGFCEDFGNADFRAPYDAGAVTDPERMTLPDVIAGPVTYRPPLLPGLMALMNVVAGRQFAGIRLLNILAMSVTGGLLWRFLRSRCGLLPAIIGLFSFLVLDVNTRLYARAILTESLAALLITLLTISLIRLSERGKAGDAVLAGCFAGLAILTRTAFLLWLPGLAAGIFWIVCRQSRNTAGPGIVDKSVSAEDAEGNSGAPTSQMTPCRPRLWRATTRSAALVCVSTAVFLPWGIRNCVVLGRIMPMGTQGMMELSAGFGETAWERGGIWFHLDGTGFFETTEQPGLARTTWELDRAERSRDAAVNWIQTHPLKAAVLGVHKVVNEYRPRTAVQGLIAVAALCGLWLSRRKQSTQILLMLHLINMLVIAVTWSVGDGRFLVPLTFSMHVLVAECLCFGRRSGDQSPIS